jgi:hypothetical protein
MNIRYDDVVHARDAMVPETDTPDMPLCGDSMIPVCAPEFTSDPVDCWGCKAILD